jgi:hypothetical protein
MKDFNPYITPDTWEPDKKPTDGWLLSLIVSGVAIGILTVTGLLLLIKVYVLARIWEGI